MNTQPAPGDLLPLASYTRHDSDDAHARPRGYYEREVARQQRQGAAETRTSSSQVAPALSRGTGPRTKQTARKSSGTSAPRAQYVQTGGTWWSMPAPDAHTDVNEDVERVPRTKQTARKSSGTNAPRAQPQARPYPTLRAPEAIEEYVQTGGTCWSMPVPDAHAAAPEAPRTKQTARKSSGTNTPRAQPQARPYPTLRAPEAIEEYVQTGGTWWSMPMSDAHAAVTGAPRTKQTARKSSGRAPPRVSGSGSGLGSAEEYPHSEQDTGIDTDPTLSSGSPDPGVGMSSQPIPQRRTKQTARKTTGGYRPTAGYSHPSAPHAACEPAGVSGAPALMAQRAPRTKQTARKTSGRAPPRVQGYEF
ncbi:hypothetical protein DENSPDRAFT_835255 [Dentipellis sp. KUC8613]|nr:hypothetical protein DENSPDRAFT_835255 [Dentipellis sp. KUC8613]